MKAVCINQELKNSSQITPRASNQLMVRRDPFLILTFLNDAEQGIQESSLNPKQHHGSNQTQEDQGKQATTQLILLVLLFSKLGMILDGMMLGVSKTSYGQVLLF